MRARVECAHLRTEAVAGARRPGSRDAGEDESEGSAREPHGGTSPRPLHEGGTVPHKTLETGDFVRSRTLKVCMG